MKNRNVVAVGRGKKVSREGWYSGRKISMLGDNPEEGKVDDVGEREENTVALMSLSRWQGMGSGGQVEQSTSWDHRAFIQDTC